MTAERVTISDIALRAGLSKSAVSLALSGRPGVSDTTRRRVLALAREMGWRANSAARALSVARSDAVGLVIATPFEGLQFETYFMRFLAGVQEALERHDMTLVLRIVSSLEKELTVLEGWRQEGRVDGVILVNPYLRDPRIPLVRRLGLPAVSAGQLAETGPDVGAVWNDDAAAMKLAVDHLIGLGHRRLARIGSAAGTVHSRVRQSAFRRAVDLASLTDALDIDSGRDVTRALGELLALPDPPTGVVVESDAMAMTVCMEARRLGFPVPECLSVVAWDDSPFCEYVNPPLTSLRRDIPAFGALVAEALAGILAGGLAGTQLAPPTSLVVRASTAPSRAEPHAPTSATTQERALTLNRSSDSLTATE